MKKSLDAVTAISGSGPAYVFHLVEAHWPRRRLILGLPQDMAGAIGGADNYRLGCHAAR